MLIPTAMLVPLVERIYTRNRATRCHRVDTSPASRLRNAGVLDTEQIAAECRTPEGAVFVPDYIGGVPIKFGAWAEADSLTVRIWPSVHFEWGTLRGEPALEMAVKEVLAERAEARA